VEIGQYDVESVPQRVIKSQALVNFISKWTNSGLWGIDDLLDHWVMYFNGSYTLKGTGAGVVLISPEGDVLKYMIQIEFPTQQHCRIRGVGHQASAGQGAQHSTTSYPGRLSAHGKTGTKGVQLQQWQDGRIFGRSVKNREVFYGFEVRYVPRLDSRDVDHVACIASSRAPIPPDVIIEKLTKPSVKAVKTLRETDLMIIDRAEQQPEIDWKQSTNIRW
jgi:hypothetical protein